MGPGALTLTREKDQKAAGKLGEVEGAGSNAAEKSTNAYVRKEGQERHELHDLSRQHWTGKSPVARHEIASLDCVAAGLTG